MISSHMHSGSRHLTRSIRCFHQSAPNQNFLQQASKWLSKLGKKTTVGAATSLFSACQVQATNPFWQSHAMVGQDFRSKHMILVLHVWLVHKRLIQETAKNSNLSSDKKRALLIQEALFDELWEDTSNRIRGQGVAELSVNKYLKQVQSYSFRTCVELDHAIDLQQIPLEVINEKYANEQQQNQAADQAVKTDETSSSSIRTYSHQEEAIMDHLAGTVYRNVYLRKEEVPERFMLALAQYLQQEYSTLSALPTESIYQGKFTFTHPRAYFLSGGKQQPKLRPQQQQVQAAAGAEEVVEEEDEWREASAEDGKVYYWNIKTREARWEKPDGKVKATK